MFVINVHRFLSFLALEVESTSENLITLGFVQYLECKKKILEHTVICILKCNGTRLQFDLNYIVCKIFDIKEHLPIFLSVLGVGDLRFGI
jgi:hypothetical protein